ncbi:hypothetical protein CBS147345_4780 [Aspergillus niger]|nr:hypothetical protein CBS147345_4780 [Aspergillus niger]
MPARNDFQGALITRFTWKLIEASRSCWWYLDVQKERCSGGYDWTPNSNDRLKLTVHSMSPIKLDSPVSLLRWACGWIQSYASRLGVSSIPLKTAKRAP